MKKLTIILVLLTVVLVGSQAEALNGSVALEYGAMTGTGTGRVELYQDIWQFRVGGIMETEILQFNLKDNWIPAGVPGSQSYEGYIKLRLTDSITIGATSWCRHYFKQDPRELSDKQDISLTVEYIFKM